MAQYNGRFHGVCASRGGPRISNLFFADDSNIFGDATERYAMEAHRILNTYESASGQKINLDKSTVVVFSRNTSTNAKEVVKGLLGVGEVENTTNFLGSPLSLVDQKKRCSLASARRCGKK